MAHTMDSSVGSLYTPRLHTNSHPPRSLVHEPPQDADKVWNLCPECRKPLLARYNMDAARRDFPREKLAGRPESLWRYAEMLPVRDSKYRLDLGEGWTPLVQATRLGETVGMTNLMLKDEGLNPTGSFKARGLGVAVSRAHELGITEVSIPSAGNAAGAMSAYAANIGVQGVGRRGHAGRRVDHGLRTHRCRGRRETRSLRLFDPEGALPDRG